MAKRKPSKGRRSSGARSPRARVKAPARRQSGVSGRAEVREFLVVAIPEKADPGATLRLLGVAGTQAAAEKLVEALDAGVLGRVAVLERRSLFVRRSAIETLAASGAIAKR